MKISISSEALNQFGAEKIAFLPKPDLRTDGRSSSATKKQGQQTSIFY